MKFQVRYGVISFFLSIRRLRVVLDRKPSQKYPVNAGNDQSSLLGPTIFLICINDKCDQVSDY